MTRSISEAAGGTGQIAANSSSVSTASDSTTAASSRTRTAVDELPQMAADLRAAVAASPTEGLARSGGCLNERRTCRRGRAPLVFWAMTSWDLLARGAISSPCRHVDTGETVTDLSCDTTTA
jgi:hypothetical protein